jgi:hypothetical protein
MMHSSPSTTARANWLSSPLPRAPRRALVVAVYLGFLVFMAIMYRGAFSEPRWPGWLAVLAVLVFGATAFGFVRLVTAPGYCADTLDRQLDERQRLVRDHAYRGAYYLVTLLFGLFALAVMYAAGDDGTWPSLRQAALLLPWLSFIPGSLPTAFVAWSEPDLPDD